MRSSQLGSVVSVCLVLTVGAAILAARGQVRPGEPTQARVWIENRAPGDAIPVNLQNAAPLRVQVTGTPTVIVDPAGTVVTRAVRQAWEYRTVTLSQGQDPANLLAAAGAEGWEAIGVLPVGQASAAGINLLFKRPR